MARRPSNVEDARGFAKYTSRRWEQVSPMYNWWARYRWSRVANYLISNHWRTVEQVGDDIDDPRISKWRRFPVIGLSLGIYADQLAQWLQSSVRFSASAAPGADPTDISRADMANAALRYVWDLTQLDEKRIDLGAWLLMTGMGSLGVFWNTSTGNLVPLATEEKVLQRDPTTGEQVLAPTGRLIPINPRTMQPDPSMREPVLVDRGEIDVEVLSPQFTRYGAKESDGVMQGSLLTEDEVIDQYGESAARMIRFSKPLEGNILDIGWLYGHGTTTNREEQGLVIRHSLPRSRRYPKGLWWVATEHGEVIQPPKPLPGGLLPTIPFRWTPMPGHWAFGVTPMYDVTHSNKAMDLVKQKQQEWMEKIVPKVLYKRGGGLAVGAFDNSPGQEVVVNAGGEPEFLVPPPYPQQFDKQRQDATDDALLVGGYQFRRQADLVEGEALNRFRQPNQLKDGNEVKLPLLSTKPSWGRLGRVLLGYIGEFYDNSRMTAVVGPDHAYQWLDFESADFANLSADIRIDEVSYYPWNRQTMRDTVVALLSTPAGQLFFQDENGQLDRQKLQAASEATGVDVALSTLNPDILEARNEIGMARSGQPIQYAQYQNSESHLVEKLTVVKSMAFKGWNAKAKQALLANIQEHQKALQKQQQAQEEAMVSQEKKLREVRAETGAAGDIRKALGEVLLQIVSDMLMPKPQDKPVDKSDTST